MEPDKYQQAWKTHSVQLKVTIDTDLLSKVVLESHEGFRSTIFWRDCREVGTALVMLPLWFYLGISKSLPWTWWLTIPALIWVAGFILVDRKRHPQRTSDPGESLVFYVKEALGHVEHQIWLLRNVFWWYLLPFCISIMAFFLQVAWNSSRTSWEFVLGAGFMGAFLFIIYGATYLLNQYAVRKQLEPRRRDLLGLVRSLAEETGEGESTATDLITAFEDPARSGAMTWETWAENWNQIVPSWGVAGAIVLPTLAGAVCGLYSGLYLRIPEMGPVFFQAVTGAVIPFEIVLFLSMYLAHRRKQQQSHLKRSSLDDDETARPLENSVVKKPAKMPAAPAMLILILTLLSGLLAVLAVYDFFAHANLSSDDSSQSAPAGI